MTCCMSSSIAINSPTGGHAAHNRASIVGSAAATFAANDTPSDRTSAAQARSPAGWPAHRRTSMVIAATTPSPSTERGSRPARQPSPTSIPSSRMCSYDPRAATTATTRTPAVVVRRTQRGAGATDTGPGWATSPAGRTGATGVGVDVLSAAIETAKRNAARHGVDDRLALVASDVYSELDRRVFDLIVSNPPYVPERDMASLQEEVRKFEPRLALTDEADGLTIIRRIVQGAPDRLVPGGLLLMEIGFGQHLDVGEMFDEGDWEEVEFLTDLQGIPRVVSAARRAR